MWQNVPTMRWDRCFFTYFYIGLSITQNLNYPSSHHASVENDPIVVEETGRPVSSCDPFSTSIMGRKSTWLQRYP